MCLFQVILVLCAISIKSSLECTDRTETLITKDWWETAQFYQIYPRSFKDSDGDGIGDLNGVTEKLDYLKSIGVTATWLSPIFESPMVDFGYDISNFFAIQKEYGTMKDFENLLKRAKELGIKIILDFVPNHSSDKCEWFIKSENMENGYEDFYIWHDGYPDPKNTSNRLPPSNWLQSFRGSAWQWSEKRKQFYLHQFTVQQPDLNYRNPRVVEQMKNVLLFWLQKGVDGFRIDAVPSLFEVKPDQNGDYPDEPLSYLTNDTQNEAYLKHIYTQDQPETLDMLYQWRELLDDYTRVYGGDSRVLLAETYSPLKVVRQYYGDGHRKGAHIPFNFNFISQPTNESTAQDFDFIIKRWLSVMPRTSTPNWVLGNHDRGRVATRLGVNRTDTMNMLLMMLPGVSVTYNGEEIGMTNGYITWEQSKDPAALNSNKSIYLQFSRDPERTPFQWDTTKNAGFSNGNTTWLPVNTNYIEINVDTEIKQNRSHLNIFKELVNLRKTETLKNGYTIHGTQGNDVLIVERFLDHQPIYVLVANFGNKTQTVTLNQFHGTLNGIFNTIIVSSNAKFEIGKSVNASTAFSISPYESIILERK